MSEQWRPVVGFPDYSVSDRGRVVSYKRPTPRVMRTRVHEDGYLLLSLSRAGQKSTHKVHRLVAEAFIGPRPGGQVTRHLDGNPANNVVSNLAYGTPSENTLDAVQHGTHTTARRTTCPQGHEYDEANTYRWGGMRYCRLCQRATNVRSRERRALRAAGVAA